MRGRRGGWTCGAPAFLAGALILSVPVGADHPAPPTFDRRDDPVILRGRDAGALNGRPAEAIRLVAVRGDRVSPVPFQIDRRDPTGRYVHHFIRDRDNDPWRPNPELRRRATLGDDDEIVFLARDAGPRLTDPSLLPAGDVVEITLLDPLNDATAYAYLAAPGSDAPRCPDDYVSFDPQRRIVDSADLKYGRCDPRQPAVLNYLAVGGSGNLLHRMRTVLHLTAIFGQIEFERNERDVETRLLEYSDGPVRVLLRQQSRVSGILWMQSDWMDRTYVNYPTRVEIPSRVRVPIRPGLVISEAQADIVLELTPAVTGARVIHPAFAAPIPLEPGQPETVHDLAPVLSQGFCLAGPFGGLCVMFREDPLGARLDLPRRFTCRPAPATDCGGGSSPPHHDLTMRIAGIERLRRGTYEYAVIVGGRRDFRPGDERDFERIDSDPIRVSAAAVLRPSAVSAMP